MAIMIQKKPLFPEILWKRPVYFYKSRAGKIFILAGSSGKSGAAILTSEAAFRSGTGVLTVGFPEGLKNVYKGLLPDAMTLALPETLGHSLAKRSGDEILDYSKSVDLVVIGPGLSQNSETQQLIWELLFSITKTIVLDADGLGAFALGLKLLRERSGEEGVKEYLKKRSFPTILTPHPGEALALLKSTGLSKDKKLNANLIDKNKEKYAPILADFLNMTVILKGHDTVVAEPNGRILVNKSGGPELAVAGTGDVLSGIVGSFIAQSVYPTKNGRDDKVFEAASTAVYLHGLAGKLAKEKLGERSVMASDIVKYLSKAIKQAEEELE